MRRDTIEGQGDEQKRPVGFKMFFPIYALLSGNIVSYVGNTLTLLAIPWFVLQTTGSVVLAGTVGFFSVISMIVSGTLSGVLVERFGYKRTSVVGDLLGGSTVLLIPLLYHTIGLAFWELSALVFVGGLLRAPASTARFALIPNLAELATMRLERANSLEEGVLRISSFLGAPLAGLLIANIGASNLLWLDASSFAFSALVIGLFVPAHMPIESQVQAKKKAKMVAKQSYFSALLEGLSFSKDSGLLLLVVVFLVTNMLNVAASAVVLPAYTLNTYKSALPLGLFLAAEGGLGFVGTAIFAAIGHRLPRRLTLVLGFILGGAMSYWILLIPNFPLQLGWFALAGLAMSPINPLIFTVIQERSPREKLPRIAGVGRAMVQAGMPLGTLGSGFLVAAIGLQATLVIMGIISLLVSLLILIDPIKLEKKTASVLPMAPSSEEQSQRQKDARSEEGAAEK